MQQTNCTQCGSDNTQKLSVAYADRSRTTQHGSAPKNDLAYQLAPPYSKEIHGELIAFVILAYLVGYAVFFAYVLYGRETVTMAGGAVLAFIPLIGILIGISTMNKPRAEAHRQQMAKWERTWFCHKCGSKFTPR